MRQLIEDSQSVRESLRRNIYNNCPVNVFFGYFCRLFISNYLLCTCSRNNARSAIAAAALVTGIILNSNAFVLLRGNRRIGNLISQRSAFCLTDIRDIPDPVLLSAGIVQGSLHLSRVLISILIGADYVQRNFSVRSHILHHILAGIVDRINDIAAYERAEHPCICFQFPVQRHSLTVIR